MCDASDGVCVWCRYTQHIDSGGAVPAWVMNKILTRESIEFVKRIGRVAASRPQQCSE